jgi:hypothetical protein
MINLEPEEMEPEEIGVNKDGLKPTPKTTVNTSMNNAEAMILHNQIIIMDTLKSLMCMQVAETGGGANILAEKSAMLNGACKATDQLLCDFYAKLEE